MHREEQRTDPSADAAWSQQVGQVMMDARETLALTDDIVQQLYEVNVLNDETWRIKGRYCKHSSWYTLLHYSIIVYMNCNTWHHAYNIFDDLT